MLAVPGAFLRFGEPDPAELGLAAERWVARRLARAGWRVLARRLATRAHEVDLVALDGDELVLVEVKAGRRLDHLRPGCRVDAARLRALEAAARELGRRTRLPARADLVEVVLRPGRPRGLELLHTRRLSPGSVPSAERGPS